MCGICGKLEFDQSKPVSKELLRRMMDAIRHRGPDDEGTYFSGGVALGHLRLSIIDLNTGHQPLSNEDGSLWIVFNGEIYNYRELRHELLQKGHVFTTATDTEVILHLYEEYGERFLEKLQGMFALAIWDDIKKALLLARDRVGIKPLYYAASPSGLVFGSEIKAILQDPWVRNEVDPNALGLFLTFQYIPGERTAIEAIRKLLPGHYLLARQGSVTVRQYWDLHFSPQPTPSKDLVPQLTSLLRDTVRGHMISDVPVGVLLSGGVDSTAMLSFATEAAKEPMHTFTVGFTGLGAIDERPYARLAAERFGSKHYEITFGASEFADFLPRYVWHMEEPVCEPPAVALFYVSKLAREHVKVLLSGEGGDEAFAGYPEYRNYSWMERAKWALGPLQPAAGWALRTAATLLPSYRVKKYGALMGAPLQQFYYSRTALPESLLSRYPVELYTPEFARVVSATAQSNLAIDLFGRVRDLDAVNQMLYVDTKTWLPDDLLIKADKITMANSLELRVPLLDHKVLEFAASLPVSQKLKGFRTKRILREVLESRVPREILERPKAGFPVPYRSWLRGELRELTNDILLSQKAATRGYFHVSAVRELLKLNENGHDYSATLFCLLVMELWHREFVDSGANARPRSETTPWADSLRKQPAAAPGGTMAGS